MIKNRYKRMLFKDWFIALRMHFKFKKIYKQNKMSFDERYRVAMDMIKKYHKDMNLNIKVFGRDNIPADIKGCLFMGNHQGQEDGAVTINSLSYEFPTSFVIADSRSHMFLFGYMCDMLGVKRIKFDDLKSQIQVYNEMTEEIQNGRRFIVFPEAGYSDNKNNLQSFNTPCFMPALKSKCPIIPFCLYDSWKSRHKDYQGYKPLDVEVHFLTPIYYEEYKDLNKKNLAELVKSRISDKMEELKKEKNEN